MKIHIHTDVGQSASQTAPTVINALVGVQSGNGLEARSMIMSWDLKRAMKFGWVLEVVVGSGSYCLRKT